MNRKVRLCIIGCGRLTMTFGLPGMTRAEGVVVSGLCEKDAWRLAAAARRCRTARTYEDYGAALADELVDAVYIATPPALHYDMVRRATEAGKHVLCEKPFTLRLDEALDLERRIPPGIVVMPAHNYLYAPGLEHAHAMVKDGLIGAVRKVENFHKANAALWNSYSQYPFAEESGGVLADDFSHLVYTTSLFAGDIRTVDHVAAERGARGVYESVEVSGTTECGAAFELLASWRSPAITWKIRISGEKGEVRVSFLTGWKAEAYDVQGRLIERRGKGNLLTLALGAYRIYQKEYEDFAGAILTGRSPRVAVADGVATARVIDAVRNWRRENEKSRRASGIA